MKFENSSRELLILETELAKLSEHLHRLTRHVMGEMHELEEDVVQFKYGPDQPGQ